MNSQLREKLASLPRAPGVYFHKSASGEVIYVGKAAVLRNRVRQYFQESRTRDAKTSALVAEIHDTDWMETESEIDALFLESEMVKRYMPRYNVLLRDGKSQSFVRIDMKSQWPTVTVTRGPLDDGAEYIGPFFNSYVLRKALRYLRRIFPYFVHEPRPGDSKLEHQIGLNPSMSLGSDTYKSSLRQLISYIKGNRKKITRELEQAMKRAARDQRYEDAARLRNKVHALTELQRRIMFGDRESLEITKDMALTQLAELLGIDGALRRIECYDVSHMSGRDVVASMVVFTNGASDRAEYRKFKTSEKNDDTANMYEAVYRRCSRKNLQGWGSPDLIMIDGGKGQLNAAFRALTDRGLSIPCIAIAKREEEIVIHINQSSVRVDEQKLKHMIARDGEYRVLNLHPGQRNASAHSKNLGAAGQVTEYDSVVKLFQRIRDEAHRFAVSYHTTLKRRRQTSSSLELITGIGPRSRARLLREFGSVAGVKSATLEQLTNVVGAQRAANIVAWRDDKR